MGRITLGRPWAIFARPKRTLFFLVAFIVVYCVFISWGSTANMATFLDTVDILKDNHKSTTIIRFGGVDIQSTDMSTFDEDRLPFDDVNAPSRKSDAQIREDFDKEYKEVGR